MIALLLALACGVRSDDPGPTAATFPHDQAFHQAHGRLWREDSAACQDCHDPLGEAHSSGPPCVSCHPAYPHVDLRPGAAHGAAWLADPTGCVGCHGHGERAPADVLGASCTGCHATFPHPEGWSHGHGAAVRTRGGPQACESCHAETATGAAPCASCHDDAYPHPPGWSAPSAHGAADLTTCASCHSEEGAPSCASCHDAYPHPAGWSPFGHVPVVQGRGEAGCLGCHDTPGPRIPQRCAPACHGASP